MTDNKKNRGLSGITLFLFVLIVLGALWFTNTLDSKESQLSRQKFEKLITSEKVDSVTITQNKNVPTGSVEVQLKNKKNGENEKNYLYVSDVNEIQKYLDKAKIDYEMSDVPRDNWFATTIFPVLLTMAGFFLIFMMMNRQGGGANSKAMSFGKSRARLSTEQDKKITFAQVAGLQEEKEDLEEIVDFLKSPKKYIQVGARIPKGVLLVGPPGTGKTLLAVARSRVTGMGGGHDEREHTLNQLLVEMDGFGVNEGIIVMAATNRVDILDRAILRPGRFDRKVMVGRPDVKGREEILKVHAKGKPLSEEIDLKQIAQTTAGFTGADLENLLNEAAILAAKDERIYLKQDDIKRAFVKVGIGAEKKSHIISEKEKKITAYHEAGHAILFHVLPDVGPVYSVSIIPTGGAGGYTMPLPERDEMYNTKGKMLQDITVSLGGRVAEEEVFDDITTGASQDIKQATNLAKAMVTKFGMSREVGLINYDNDSDEVFIGRDLAHTSRGYGESVATVIDKEVKRFIDECYARAKQIIEEHEDVLHACAELLLEKEKISREEFEALFHDEPVEA